MHSIDNSSPSSHHHGFRQSHGTSSFHKNVFTLCLLRSNHLLTLDERANETKIILQVLDAGRLREFDAPYTLLKNPRTLFSQLVAQTGPMESKRLFETARHKYYEKKTIPETEENNDSCKSHGESVDGFQSRSAVTLIVPIGTGSQPQTLFQFESTV